MSGYRSGGLLKWTEDAKRGKKENRTTDEILSDILFILFSGVFETEMILYNARVNVIMSHHVERRKNWSGYKSWDSTVLLTWQKYRTVLFSFCSIYRARVIAKAA